MKSEFCKGKTLPQPTEGGEALAVFRIVLGVVLLFQAWQTFGYVEFIGTFIPQELELVLGPFWYFTINRISNLVSLPEATVRFALFWLYVGSLMALTVGIKSRFSAMIALATHVFLKMDSYHLSYGAHELATISLFYCVFLPVDQNFSIFTQSPLLKVSSSYLFLRLHMSVIYFAAGVEKLLGEQWWSGEAINRALARPMALGDNISSVLDTMGPLLAVAAVAAAALQCLYVACIWTGRTRLIGLVVIEFFHMVIAVTMGLWVFSGIMTALNLGALGDSKRLGQIARRIKLLLIRKFNQRDREPVE